MSSFRFSLNESSRSSTCPLQKARSSRKTAAHSRRAGPRLQDAMLAAQALPEPTQRPRQKRAPAAAACAPGTGSRPAAPSSNLEARGIHPSCSVLLQEPALLVRESSCCSSSPVDLSPATGYSGERTARSFTPAFSEQVVQSSRCAKAFLEAGPCSHSWPLTARKKCVMSGRP